MANDQVKIGFKIPGLGQATSEVAALVKQFTALAYAMKRTTATRSIGASAGQKQSVQLTGKRLHEEQAITGALKKQLGLTREAAKVQQRADGKKTKKSKDSAGGTVGKGNSKFGAGVMALGGIDPSFITLGFAAMAGGPAAIAGATVAVTKSAFEAMAVIAERAAAMARSLAEAEIAIRRELSGVNKSRASAAEEFRGEAKSRETLALYGFSSKQVKDASLVPGGIEMLASKGVREPLSKMAGDAGTITSNLMGVFSTLQNQMSAGEASDLIEDLLKSRQFRASLSGSLDATMGVASVKLKPKGYKLGRPVPETFEAGIFNTFDKDARIGVNRGFNDIEKFSPSLTAGSKEASHKTPFSKATERLVDALNKTKDAIAVNTAEMKARSTPWLENLLPNIVYGASSYFTDHDTALGNANNTPRLSMPGGMADLEAKNTVLRAQAAEYAEALRKALLLGASVDGGGI